MTNTTPQAADLASRGDSPVGESLREADKAAMKRLASRFAESTGVRPEQVRMCMHAGAPMILGVEPIPSASPSEAQLDAKRKAWRDFLQPLPDDVAADFCSAIDGARSSEAQKAVAWCALTANGQIAYFDGKPMVMPGPVGNDCHPTPLYTHPSAGAGAEPQELPMLTEEHVNELHDTAYKTWALSDNVNWTKFWAENIQRAAAASWGIRLKGGE